MRTVGIIPARGGSTRIPQKNLAPLAGSPLIAHTIRAALEAETLDGVWVSTDDPAIGAAARSFGAQVIWRPPELATAEAPTEPALQHAVQEIERAGGQPVGAVVLLQATSPLRAAHRIDEAVRLQRQTGCDAVVSVVQDIHYYFLGQVDDAGRLQVGYDPANRLRTQDIPPRYRENGAIYVTARHQLMDRGCRMGGDTRAVIMEAWESIDIDDPLDLQICAQVHAWRKSLEAPCAAPLQALGGAAR